MNENIGGAGLPLDEAAFIKTYGDTLVDLGGRGVPLSTALEMEEAFCPADSEKRQDPAIRLTYLARMVGENTLSPQHRYLLVETPSKPV